MIVSCPFKLMKRIFLALTLVTTFFLSHGQVIGDSWQKILKNSGGILSVVYCETPGIIYKNSKGQMDGLCSQVIVDFATYVKSKYNCKIRIEYIKEEKEFSKFFEIIRSGSNIVGVANTSITEERKKIILFTPKYLHNPLILLTTTNIKTANSIDDLLKENKNIKGFVENGTSYHRMLKNLNESKNPNMIIVPQLTLDAVLNSVVKNQNSFAVLSLIEYLDAVRKKYPLKKHNIKFASSEDVAFILPKNSDWIEPWNEFLTSEYLGSPEYHRMIAKHLGSSFLEFMLSN